MYSSSFGLRCSPYHADTFSISCGYVANIMQIRGQYHAEYGILSQKYGPLYPQTNMLLVDSKRCSRLLITPLAELLEMSDNINMPIDSAPEASKTKPVLRLEKVCWKMSCCPRNQEPAKAGVQLIAGESGELITEETRAGVGNCWIEQEHSKVGNKKW